MDKEIRAGQENRNRNAASFSGDAGSVRGHQGTDKAALGINCDVIMSRLGGGVWRKRHAKRRMLSGQTAVAMFELVTGPTWASFVAARVFPTGGQVVC